MVLQFGNIVSPTTIYWTFWNWAYKHTFGRVSMVPLKQVVAVRKETCTRFFYLYFLSQLV